MCSVQKGMAVEDWTQQVILLPEEAFSWYLDLRRYGSVPHAGFGMGIERMVTWLCGLHHVREAIPFPRMLERVTP